MELKNKTVLFLGSSVTFGSASGGVSFVEMLGEACGITAIRQDGNTVFFTQESPDIDIWSDISDLVKGRIRFTGAGSDAQIKLMLRQGEDMLGIIHKIFEKYLSLCHA